jgi:hypothetical protein
MTAHKNSRLLPCHRGVFGVNVEPVEVCFCGLGLLDCVPPIFFDVGGQARSGRVVGRCSSIKGSLPCVSTWQRVFTVPWRMAKAIRHGKVSLPCAGARQRPIAQDNALVRTTKDVGTENVQLLPTCTVGRHPILSLFLSQPLLCSLAPNPAAAASQPSRRSRRCLPAQSPPRAAARRPPPHAALLAPAEPPHSASRPCRGAAAALRPRPCPRPAVPRHPAALRPRPCPRRGAAAPGRAASRARPASK